MATKKKVAAGTDGMGYYHFAEIENSENFGLIIEKKYAEPGRILSIHKGHLSASWETPLYIYGAFSVAVIFSENGKIEYTIGRFQSQEVCDGFMRAYQTAYDHYRATGETSFKL